MSPKGNPGIPKSPEHRSKIGEGVKENRRQTQAELEQLIDRLRQKPPAQWTRREQLAFWRALSSGCIKTDTSQLEAEIARGEE